MTDQLPAAHVEPIPVPSHIHYELLMQLLERQTLPAIPSTNRKSREMIQDAIINLRKAMALQRQFESICDYQAIPVTYRWSLNEAQKDGDIDNAQENDQEYVPKKD